MAETDMDMDTARELDAVEAALESDAVDTAGHERTGAEVETEGDADADAGDAPVSSGQDTPGKPGTQPPRRRNRPALSCIQCRSRKIRCNREEPCSSCLKSKIVNCSYEEARRPRPRLWRLSPSPSSANGGHDGHSGHDPHLDRHRPPAVEDPSYPRYILGRVYRDSRLAVGPPSGAAYASSATSLTTGTVSGSTSAASPIGARLAALGHDALPMMSSAEAALAERVQLLEQQLADALKTKAGPGDAPSNEHGVISKTRYFGASHWMNSIRFFPFLVDIFSTLEKDKSSEIYQLLIKCKLLGRAIKAKREPSRLSFDIGTSLPPQATCYRLLDAYFRTFESTYRILHVPSFWRDYHKYWEHPSLVNETFIIQMQLCMAIGSAFQDDTLALRASVVHWIYETQFWLVSPSEKSRMSLAGLQIMCLLHVAREVCGVGADLTWISAGSLVRTAMYMGLHRDPENLPRMTPFKAEIRRRLWATILEIALQSSLDAGGPPLISFHDFDTHQPSNYDDDQLSEEHEVAPSPRPSASFTQSTVQLALLRSFTTRLAIAQYINNFRSAMVYEETLRWNTELSMACRTLSATLKPAFDPAGVLPKRLNHFHLQLAEHMVHRFFLALNHPWLWSAQNNPAYYFARKMCVETSLKLAKAYNFGSQSDVPTAGAPISDFARLALCGHGGFRSAPHQVATGIALELFWQIQEDQSFRKSMNLDARTSSAAAATDDQGPTMGSGVAPRAELMEVIRSCVEWQRRRIQLGETNVKGYAASAAMVTHFDDLQRGVPEAEIVRDVTEVMTQKMRDSWELLKRMNGDSDTPQNVVADLEASVNDADLAAGGVGAGFFDDLGLGAGPDWELEGFLQQNNFNFFPNVGPGGFAPAPAPAPAPDMRCF